MKLEERTDLIPSSEKDPLETLNEGPVVAASMEAVVVNQSLSFKKVMEPLKEGITSTGADSPAHLEKRKSGGKEKSLRCGICGIVTTNRPELTAHRNTHRHDGLFQCSFCGKTQKEYFGFVSHLNTHTGQKPHKCETCGRQFEFRSLLKDHTNLHSGEKPHLCAVCGQRFALKASLLQHSRKHRPMQFRCRFCEQGASNRSDLAKHERTHTGERPYMCDVCGVGYTQSSHLHDHARMHLGQRPLKCDLCGRGFLKKGDMLRHRRIHTGELPYLCLLCGKAFRQKTQCSNHVKHHHPEAVDSTAVKAFIKTTLKSNPNLPNTSAGNLAENKHSDNPEVQNQNVCKPFGQITHCSSHKPFNHTTRKWSSSPSKQSRGQSEQFQTELLADVRETTQLLLRTSTDFLLDNVKETADMLLSSVRHSNAILTENVSDTAELLLSDVGDTDLVFDSHDMQEQFISNAVSSFLN